MQYATCSAYPPLYRVMFITLTNGLIQCFPSPFQLPPRSRCLPASRTCHPSRRARRSSWRYRSPATRSRRFAGRETARTWAGAVIIASRPGRGTRSWQSRPRRRATTDRTIWRWRTTWAWTRPSSWSPLMVCIIWNLTYQGHHLLLLASPGSPQRFSISILILTSASSSVSSTTAMSSFTASTNLLLGLPRFLFPGSSILSILLPVYPSYFLSDLASRVFSRIKIAINGLYCQHDLIHGYITIKTAINGLYYQCYSSDDIYCYWSHIAVGFFRDWSWMCV